MYGCDEARDAERSYKVYFPSPKAAIPVALEDGGEIGCPRRAFGLVQRFMEKDAERTSHWFDLAPNEALQCVVIGEREDRRVYVVTTTPPEQFAWVHDRWQVVSPLIRNRQHDFC